jgi:hypothetical protein
LNSSVTAFLENRIIARGGREAVTRIVEEKYPADHSAIRVFEDESGRVVDLDYWDAGAPLPAKGPGRPKLGVVSREITLLPRQWEWLARQKGGASAVIRRLVDEASKAPPSPGARRDAAYRFMSDLCGDRPGYEEALRAMYRGERERLQALIAEWPGDVRKYVGELLG